jgi:hypothetical protein
MLFDKFAGIVERHLPELKPIFDKAAIFNIKNINDNKIQDSKLFLELCENFILPFETIAIEHENNCCLVWDYEHDTIGLSKKRGFAVYETSIGETRFDWLVNIGDIENLTPVIITETKKPGTYEPAVKIHTCVIGDKRKCKIFRNGVTDLISRAMVEFSIYESLEHIIFLNDYNRFIVEIIPEKPRKGNNKRITRTPDRSTYTLLTISEIQKKYGLGKSETIESRKSPAPHPRRRHYRILRSDKFTHKQGQRILIPATWIGKSEVTMGNKIYKVRLDV